MAMCQWRDKELPRTLIRAKEQGAKSDRSFARRIEEQRTRAPFRGACRPTEQLGRERWGNMHAIYIYVCRAQWLGGSLWVANIIVGGSWRQKAKSKGHSLRKGIGRKDADIYLTSNARNREIWYARKLDNWPDCIMGVDCSGSESWNSYFSKV